MLEMHEVLPVLSVTVFPSVLLLAVAYPLRGQGGRRAAGRVVRVPGNWSPLDVRTRRAVAHFAAGRREPGLGAGR